MKINHPNKIREFFIQKLYGLIYRIENTGNGDFIKNGELNFLKSLDKEYQNKPFVFFDIGANIGEYTEMVMSNIRPSSFEGHLFEPQKNCFTTLNQKFQDSDGIHIHNVGLSDIPDTKELYKDQDQSGLASLYNRKLQHYNLEMKQSEKITLETCKKYIDQYSITKINLIKIDIEGHELKALMGFSDFLHASNIDFIQFEYGGANLDSKTSLLDLFHFFSARGFILCKIMKSGLTKFEYNPRFENFMYQNWVAVNPKLITTH